VAFRDDRGAEHTLGLMAENVTDTIECDPDEFSPPGISSPETPYLGEIATLKDRIVQRIEVDALLPKNVRDTLFR
jgi:chemotaxis-related protein WspB